MIDLARGFAALLGALPRAIAVLLGGLGLSGCLHRHPPAPVRVAHPHYELGPAYQADGFWYYPAEAYELDTTGIATLDARNTEWHSADANRAGLTADGELRDPTALTAAMQTIQLPAIAEITNLENGRQIEIRVNDRGPATPSRIIALSPRAAALLAISTAARIRIRVDQTLSHRLVDQLGGGPRLRIAIAPAATITAESLPPPGGGQAGPARRLGTASQEDTAPTVADRLPEQVRMTTPAPGQLFLQCGSFGRFTYANVTASKLSGLGADVVRSRDGRQTTYTVQAGPYATIPQADSALAQALRAGVIDARITVR